MKIEIKPYNEECIAVSFQEGFTTEILDTVRNLPKRKWINDKKVWLIPNTQESIDKLLENIYTIGLFNYKESEFKKNSSLGKSSNAIKKCKKF